MTEPKAVPPLSAKQAQLCVDAQDSISLQRVLREHCRAIASGEAVVIPRITREALREALGEPHSIDIDCFRAWRISDIIAALERLGVKIGE